MSSAPREIVEDIKGLLSVEHVDSLKKASSSRQPNDSQRQETTLSTDAEGNSYPEEETVNGAWTARLVFHSRSRG